MSQTYYVTVSVVYILETSDISVYLRVCQVCSADAEQQPSRLHQSGRCLLVVGQSSCDRTSMLRDAARVCSDVFDKSVVIVDTSNSIAGMHQGS